MNRVSKPPSRWLLYASEALELAAFMVSACVCTVLLFGRQYSGPAWFAAPVALRTAMGVAMGLTAWLIIHSPCGKLSGAHFNPAITLTYLRLGKIGRRDAFFYVVFQFIGGIAGVGASKLMLGARLAAPGVQYAVTVPGLYGTAGAFAAELFMAALLMSVVLYTSNRPRLAPYTSYCVGVLIALYIVVFAPISGFSINPARTVGSAVFAHMYTALWLYFVAPLLGMFGAAEAYLRAVKWTGGRDAILCAKLHPDPAYPCPFLCHFPGHRHSPPKQDAPFMTVSSS